MVRGIGSVEFTSMGLGGFGLPRGSNWVLMNQRKPNGHPLLPRVYSCSLFL